MIFIDASFHVQQIQTSHNLKRLKKGNVECELLQSMSNNQER